MNNFLYTNDDEGMGDPGLYPLEGLLRQVEIFNQDSTNTPCTLDDFDVHELDGTYEADTMHVVNYWIAEVRHFTMVSKRGDDEPLKWGTLRKLPDIDDFSDNILSPFAGLRNVEATSRKIEFTIDGTDYLLETTNKTAFD